MTEAQWLASLDCMSMLNFLRRQRRVLVGKANRRRLRLAVCACVRRVWHLIDNATCRQALEVSERFADGQATAEELQNAYTAAGADLGKSPPDDDPRLVHFWASNDARLAADPDLWESRWAVYPCVESRVWQWTDLSPDNQRGVCEVLREVFGNPFRPCSLGKTWRSPAIRALAEEAYVGGDFTGLPILADALEDAGCDNAELLGHLRGPGPHVRGCWVVDLLLGKQ
jgi:hypothetical protein